MLICKKVVKRVTLQMSRLYRRYVLIVTQQIYTNRGTNWFTTVIPRSYLQNFNFKTHSSDLQYIADHNKLFLRIRSNEESNE